MTSKEAISKAKLEGVRKQAHKNMRLLLKKLNFHGYDFGDRLTGCCPISHKDGRTPNDNDKAFSWDFKRQMWQCFTHRCHNVHGSDIFALVRSARACSFREAVEWILSALDQNVDDIKEIDPAEAQKLEQIIRKRSQLVQHQRMEEEIMRHLQPSNYFERRGFSQAVIKEFNCGGEWHRAGTYGEDRAIVPIYDPIDGFLIAFTCRLLDDSIIEAWRPKWCHALNFAEMRKKSVEKTDEERFHASSVLFNLHRAKEHMGDSGTIIIVEGPGDVMRLWEAGLKNTVAVLGTGFSKHHKTLLHKVGCRRILCVLDADEAGQKGGAAVERMCKDYFEYVSVKLPNGKDPGEHDPAQLRLIFKEYL